MTIEQEVFRRYKVNRNALIRYGFNRFDDIYTYDKYFLDDAFKAIIVIDENGIVKGKVIETDFEDEYTQIRNPIYKGKFVNKVREEYRNILLDIRKKCFKKQFFISEQANRLAELIFKEYKEEPDFPFDTEKYKGFGVFRYPKNRKWYALIMNVDMKVFSEKKENIFVDVINLKADETQSKKTLKTKGIYPAYHMNKKKWISIILDDSLTDEEIMSYIDVSRTFVIPVKKAKKK